MIKKNFVFAHCIKACFLCFSIFVFTNNTMAANTEWLPPPPDTFIISLTLECGDDSLLICTNLNGIGGQLSSAFACSSPVNGSLTVYSDTCFYYHPVQGFWGNEEACIVICNDANECDTFYFEIFVENCIQQVPCTDIPYDLFTATVDGCSDLVKICNSFPLGEALLYDFTINGAPYNGNLGICAFDTLYSYSYGSIPDGGMAGPYELQSWVVDGNTYSGQFNTIQELVDLMNMFDLSGNWQIDATTFNFFSFNTSSVYGLMTIIQPSTNDIAILSRNSTTAPIGSSIYLSTGISEVILQHQIDSFCIDTFLAVVNCEPYKVAFDTINLGQSKTMCVDPSTVPGNLQNVNVKCFSCQSIFVSQNNYCVEYHGIAVGTDSLLITGCDQYGLCDSILQIVSVRDNSILPHANIDSDTTSENTSLLLDILANDDLNGQLKNIFILIYPQNGEVVIGTDFSITYTPAPDYCGIDAFAYQICNENGCDTSTATIFVRCNSPLVYNGFSPNDDGRNDTFTIFNIEEYPNNQLRIFNRWGNLVYEKKDYRNEWDGRSLGNDVLPDGTYFYLFEMPGEERLSGYVQISR